MTNERIDNALEVINYAIEKQISVYEASQKCGYASSYVKNVKRDILSRYGNGTLDDEIYDKFMSSYEKYETQSNNKSKPKDTDNSLEGESFEVNEEGSKLEFDWKNSGKPKHFDDVLETNFEKLKNSAYPPYHIKTLEDLIKRCDVNLDDYNVIRHIVNKWDVTGFIGSGDNKRPLTWENFQVKATLELKKEIKQARELSDVFNELIKDITIPESKVNLTTAMKLSSDDENNLLEISLFDLHIGKLGWAGEVGENFDTKIAYSRFMDAINNLLERARGMKYSRILFPIGNDFFNSDNLHNTTTAGTPQDEDLRWQKTFKLGCQLIIDAIKLLKLKEVPIDVVVIPGNHDFERSYYLGTVMEAWFRDDNQVNIDNSAMPRKYYTFGKVLLGLTHGKEEKENSLPMLMASEKPELWGKSSFREWHLGHFHKKRNVNFTIFDKAQVLNEEHGVIVRYLSSLSGTEEWHFKKGYTGSAKAGEAFLWNDNYGMVAHFNFNFTAFNREE